VTTAHNQPAQPLAAPEPFPPALLEQPVGKRQEYFEQQCLIAHPRLMESIEATIQAVCPAGDGAPNRRPGTMVLGIGPSRVGKTTFIRLLEARLAAQAAVHLRADPAFIPFASILAAGAASGRFEWVDYYRAVLRALHDPFVDGIVARLRLRDLRDAMTTALIERNLRAVIVDEAQHLAKAASGRRLQDQLDHLKHIENATGVSHILVGTYEMRPFRTVNAQLACRGVDVHFPRYDATKAEERRVFQSVVWALQRQLPVAHEPPLLDQWEFLYARSIGCIGLLKMHLNRALHLALAEQAKTVTPHHVRATALPAARVELALHAALESEAELTEAAAADDRLLTLLGMRERQGATAPTSASAGDAAKPAQRGRRGTRTPSRDPIGQAEHAAVSQTAAGEQAAG
jgi:hypothetical protein